MTYESPQEMFVISPVSCLHFLFPLISYFPSLPCIFLGPPVNSGSWKAFAGPPEGCRFPTNLSLELVHTGQLKNCSWTKDNAGRAMSDLHSLKTTRQNSGNGYITLTIQLDTPFEMPSFSIELSPVATISRCHMPLLGGFYSSFSPRTFGEQHRCVRIQQWT